MGNLREILSLMERMENNERVHSDENFDLDKMPMDLLDKAWKRYHPYEFTIDHDNMLAAPHTIRSKESLDKLKDTITSTFEIPSEHFLIKEDIRGTYILLLIALTDDNVDIIIKHLENQTVLVNKNIELLFDNKNRKWLGIKFIPVFMYNFSNNPHGIDDMNQNFEYMQKLFENLNLFKSMTIMDEMKIMVYSSLNDGITKTYPVKSFVNCLADKLNIPEEAIIKDDKIAYDDYIEKSIRNGWKSSLIVNENDNKLCILYSDDNLVNIRPLEKILNLCGYDINDEHINYNFGWRWIYVKPSLNSNNPHGKFNKI